MNREEAIRKNLKGKKLLEVGQYDEAVKLFTEAIESDENYATAWLNRSDANRKLGREAEANADKEKGESLMRAATRAESVEGFKEQQDGNGYGVHVASIFLGCWMGGAIFFVLSFSNLDLYLRALIATGVFIFFYFMVKAIIKSDRPLGPGP